MPIVYQRLRKAAKATFIGASEEVSFAEILARETVRVEGGAVIEQSGTVDTNLIVPPSTFEGQSEAVARAELLVQGTVLVNGTSVIEQSGALDTRLIVPSAAFSGASEAVAFADLAVTDKPDPHINDAYIESTRNSSSDYDLYAEVDMFDATQRITDPTAWLNRGGSSGPSETLVSKDSTEVSVTGDQYRFEFDWNQGIVAADGETYNIWLTEGDQSDDRIVDAESITITHPTTNGNTNTNSETFDDTQESSP